MADTPRKGRKNGKPGPKRDPDLMELAVHLRLRGQSWRQVGRSVGVALSTLMDWKDTEEWKVIRERLANGRADKLVHLSFEVLARKLGRELSRRNPDTALAEKLWERTMGPADDGEYPRAPGAGGVGLVRHIVELPIMDEGLESKPPTQVLLAASPAPSPPAAPAPAPKGKKPMKPKPTKRTAAGPDE